ncbi:hypothetical protein [Polluticaenibacter yanchengensis]|uniref:Outer membrane beta-barrel protein n=1 Tax=Polluticaenibacter yanchengensis TaxID=3014562 RepID=A0ABT4UI65_9BACT|nr:outer membrane beta-barrel protein [Chitinophagaceae bacterium LY-5]
MKKILLGAALLFVSVFNKTNAQAVEKGNFVINAGIGLGGLDHAYDFNVSPQYLVSADKAIWEIGNAGVIGLGAFLGTKSYKYDNFGVKEKWSQHTIGVRGTFNFGFIPVEKLNVYAGPTIEYTITTGDGDYFFDKNLIGAGALVGARYYFTPNIGVFTELNAGGNINSLLRLGAAFKF